MATKMDPTSSVEPGRVHSTSSISTSSIVSASSPKVSMFGAKSGFVIPKNKLSGSLIPIFRGGGKVEGSSTVKEDGTKQVQRKTKWGVDLTQDAAVRKGRALAYQTRVEQITQQLNSGALEIGDDQDSQSSAQALKHDSVSGHTDDEVSSQKMQSKKTEALELEKREVIGEILRLNPSYKTPLDYKPLLKEAKVPVPNKAYPGYNVIGLLLGPESNTQKRLEEETGAKVRIHGTKVDAGEKHEVPLSGISSDTQGAYEELYVHVSADTYEKVDAAVALIELLLTPVSGSSTVTSSSTSVAADLATPMTTVSQGVLQPSFMPAQHTPPQFHPYLTPWYPTAPSGAPHPPGGFMPVHRFPLPPGGPLTAPPYFGQPPFSSLPRTLAPPASRPQLPMQPNQAMPSQNRPMPGQHPPSQTMPPQNRPMPGQQPPPAYSVMRPHPSSAPPAQFSPAQPMPVSRPPLALNLQQAPVPMGTVPMRPLRAPVPPGWPSSPPLITPPLRSSNVTQMAPVSRPQPSFPNNMTNRPPIGNFAPPPFSSAPPMGPVSGPPMLSSSSGPPLSAPMPAPVPLITPISRPALPPVQSPQPPPSVTPMRSPTVTAPKPVRPNSGDFTFQPLRAQVPPSPTTPGPTSPLVAPQAPSFRPAVQSPAQPSFSVNPISIQPPPMLPFPNPRPAPPMASTTQMGPPSFTPAPQAPNLAPSTQMGRPVFPPPPATQMGRPGFSPLNQQFQGNQLGPVVGGPASSSGGNQIYDPFSPTSISPRPGGDPTKARKPETDAEYEDLMASVGVK